MNDPIELTLRSSLEAAGFIAAQIEPMPEGGSNRLYKVTVVDGPVVVARIPKSGNAKFRMEEALMAAASGAGVPVPDVIHLANEEPDPPILLTTYLRGTTLDKVAKNFDRDQLSTVASEIGRTLAKIHTLDLGSGFGNLDDEMRGTADSFLGWFIGDLEPVVVRLKKVLRGDAAAAAGLDRAVSFISENKNLLGDSDPVLLHGDYRAGNLIFDHLKLVGVIDWEAAKRGPAALDFAWWDWATRESDVPIRAQDFLEGYQEVRTLESTEFSALEEILFARITIGHMDWTVRIGNKDTEARARLALERFGGRLDER